MLKLFAVFLFAFGLPAMAAAQYLDKVCPVMLQQGRLTNDVSFVLTTTDYNFFRKQPNRFENSIQIIDANQPWPPRWFADMPFDSLLGLPYSALIPLNASYQNNQFSFFTILKTKEKNKEENRHGFIICNPELEITDTFILPCQDLDHHDFRTETNGEKLLFALHDTVVDMSKIHNNPKDTALNLSYEIIEIADSQGHVSFCWDPMRELGAAAQFVPYFIVKGIWTRHDIFDWSHGNSICFDDDGNILYSFKFIGIGKISRKDGHIIWKLDRDQQQANSFSDTIPFYLQHDFKGITDEQGNHFYSFFCNGDATHKLCSVCQFTVKDTLNGQKVFRIKKRFFPEEKIPNTNGGGNYDVEPNGNYVVNYGTFRGDSALPRTLFEYRNSKDDLLARYTITPYTLAYRVHKLNNWRPDRPVVKINKGLLSVSSTNDVTWYQLDEQNHTASVAGHSKTFKPVNAGSYCAVVKYGFGYSVSAPVDYRK